MSSYREQQSCQSCRMGRKRLASRESSSVQSITPSAIDTKMGRSRTTRLSASQTDRAPVQPPVCGVQPGRVLELRTAMGLVRARVMLEEQIEQERRQKMFDEALMRGWGRDQMQLPMKGQLLKHGRLKPLGVVSDQLMMSNSCIGIVSVNTRSSNHQRQRSCTMPEVHCGSSGYLRDNGDFDTRRKDKKRSYSAVTLPHRVSVDKMRELTANLSITKQTGLIPEDTTTNKSTEATVGSNDPTNRDQRQTKMPQNSTPRLGTSEAKSSEHNLETLDALTDKIQVLPPVVRQGELGQIKVEVKRFSNVWNPATPETANSVPKMNDKQQSSVRESHSRAIKRLPKVRDKERMGAEKSSHLSPESKEKSNTDPPDEGSFVARSSSSMRKVSIVSLGETSSILQQTEKHHRHLRRKRRHSESRQMGSQLSQGWSSPRLDSIEPVVGSPLHTPRKHSAPMMVAQRNSHKMSSSSGVQGSLIDLEALQSQATSPGMFISVDVNEFLRDIENDDETQIN